jgi:hypothetical protein
MGFIRCYAFVLIIKNKDMDKQEKCNCKEPILQPQTKQCGRCKLYIDRVRHILLTNPNEALQPCYRKTLKT